MRDYYLNNYRMVKIWESAFEGEDEAAAVAATEAAAAAAAAAAAKGKEGNNGFTPDQQKIMDDRLAAQAKDYQGKISKAAEELRALQQRSDLTVTQRKEMEAHLETIQNELLTKEQLADKEKQKLIKKGKEEVDNLTSEVKIWKERFTDSTIQRAIIDAAVESNAFNPEQVVAILRRDTEIVDVLDKDGKPTGVLEPRVKFLDPEGKDGKPAELVLAPNEAVKRMTELGKYFNLFKDAGTGGVGSMSRSTGKTVDAAALAKDTVAYRNYRKEHGPQ